MKLAHTLLGEGPRRTVLLHGFLGSGRNLSTLARRWMRVDPERSFLLLDLGGHGSSPPLASDADLASMAADVLETSRELGLEEPVEILGHSLGGRVAMAGALTQPERVGTLYLLDIAPGPIGRGDREMQSVADVLFAAPESAASREEMREYFLGMGLSQGLVEWLLMNLRAAGGRYEWRIDRAALQAKAGQLNTFDLWPAIEGGERRVVCVKGGRSRYVRDEDAQRMKAAGVEVHVIENAGHFVHVDAPEELVAILSG